LCTVFDCFAMIIRVHENQAEGEAGTSAPALTRAKKDCVPK
jgi:hypothetical protein